MQEKLKEMTIVELLSIKQILDYLKMNADTDREKNECFILANTVFTELKSRVLALAKE